MAKKKLPPFMMKQKEGGAYPDAAQDKAGKPGKFKPFKKKGKK